MRKTDSKQIHLEMNIGKGQKDQELEDLRLRLKEIEEKYSDPRRKSWDKEDEKDFLKEKLHIETTIEKILEIIADGKFTVDESERIFSEAQKRISISTPVKVIPCYRNNLIEDSVQDSHQDKVRRISKADELIEMLADCIIEDIKKGRAGGVVEKTKVLAELVSARTQNVTLLER